MCGSALYGQQSLDFFGNSQSVNSTFRLNSLESNSGNSNFGKDWELALSLSGIRQKQITGNVFMLSLSKRINENYLYLRYTPGYIQDFTVSSGIKLLVGDSLKFNTSLNTKIHMAEIFGFGYSYKISEKLSAGFSLRYFEQKFQEDQPEPVFTDTANYITSKTTVTNSNFWRGDLGVTYSLQNFLTLSVSSQNLFLTGKTFSEDVVNKYALKNEKGAALTILYSPLENLGINYSIETSGSMIGGISSSSKLFGLEFGFGISAFHDRYQFPFVAGIQPFISVSSHLFNISISGIKYFNDRSNPLPFSELISNGIHNLMNNQFSFDRINLNTSVALSFVPEKKVRFIGLEIKEQIFPTLEEKYLDTPVAVAEVRNLTDKPVSVKPALLIRPINGDLVYSREVIIPAKDTCEVKFFTTIHPDHAITKREIAEADFYLYTTNSDPDEMVQKPILINDINSWDGAVVNLSYFVRRDYDFSSAYSKNIFARDKEKIDSTAAGLKIFQKVRLLFNEFVKNMVYVSDPRADVEHVQFPHETIKLKGGDCDDLSVCFSSLLESVGIETAFVDFKNPDGVSHVNLLINTQLLPGQSSLITNNDKKIFVRKNSNGVDQIWIPLETTSLNNFETAWSAASDKFEKEALEQFGLAKGTVVIVDF
ncbi:MAG: transglutaminase-like domain-containing protein [Bacteroidetes bacterium]|nr:transglutaminase-like domain-containing protein [Bacteroidota bacterium]